MGRHKKVIPSVRKELRLPQDVVARIELELFSEVHGCVPIGDWSDLIERLLRDFIQKLDQQKKVNHVQESPSAG